MDIPDTSATIEHLPVWRQDREGWRLLVGNRTLVSLIPDIHSNVNTEYQERKRFVTVG
jgi:hypothetical protein